MAEDVLSFGDVVVAFGALRAVDGVTMSVPQGERRAIIGPNGAGKTTLFNAATGVVRPTAGRIVFDQADITALPPHRRAPPRAPRPLPTTHQFFSPPPPGHHTPRAPAGPARPVLR